MDNKLFYASREHGQVCNESSRGRVMPGTGGQEELPEMRMEVSLFRRWAAAKPLLTVRRRDTLFVSPGVATKSVIRALSRRCAGCRRVGKAARGENGSLVVHWPVTKLLYIVRRRDSQFASHRGRSQARYKSSESEVARGRRARGAHSIRMERVWFTPGPLIRLLRYTQPILNRLSVMVSTTKARCCNTPSRSYARCPGKGHKNTRMEGTFFIHGDKHARLNVWAT